MSSDRGAVPRIVLVIVALVVLALATVGYFLLESRKHRELGRYHFEMQSSLLNLASYQEIYFSRHESFASDACADGARCDRLGFDAPADISLTTTGAGDGWFGVVTHAALPDERCDIHVGEAASPGVSTVPDQVACTVFWP